MFGPPGAGKGTQATQIARKTSSKHISTGDMLREAIANQTEIGNLANEYMSGGRLVPDEVVVQIVKDKILSEKLNDFILDGFPRTIPQAEDLDAMLGELNLPLDYVVNLRIEDQVIIGRLSDRRVCPKCGESYNLTFNPSKISGICDICSNELIHRKDDEPTAIKNRLVEYSKKTEPLIEYYREQGKLLDVDASGSINEIQENIVRSLNL